MNLFLSVSLVAILIGFVCEYWYSHRKLAWRIWTPITFSVVTLLAGLTSVVCMTLGVLTNTEWNAVSGAVIVISQMNFMWFIFITISTTLLLSFAILSMSDVWLWKIKHRVTRRLPI